MFMFVVKPLGTCRGWGSSRSVALLSAPPEAQCAAPGGPHPVAPHAVTGAGAFPRGGIHRRRGKRAVGGYRVRCQQRPLWTRVGPFSRITSATAIAGGTLCSRGGAPCGAPRLAPSS
ncbi:unnamed protein product [Pleuronectes platessa]|uniref:Uncharacterized protein n=1 Tax=Pleuronectes platessa TaxID=8262 RepID=A0A9N7UJ94_PLEPL|nr:unnamed protein product [Pleuronectes platessa]